VEAQRQGRDQIGEQALAVERLMFFVQRQPRARRGQRGRCQEVRAGAASELELEPATYPLRTQAATKRIAADRVFARVAPTRLTPARQTLPRSRGRLTGHAIG